jgi:hypothetical protein
MMRAKLLVQVLQELFCTHAQKLKLHILLEDVQAWLPK